MTDIKMSNYANNPQTFINGYISGVRNVFLLTTVGIGMYGFSKSFKNKNSETILRLFSTMIYCFAFLYLVNTNMLFRTYLNKIQNSPNEEKLPEYIDLKYWRNYEYLTWIYSLLLSIIILLASKRFIKILLGIKQ